MLRCHVGMRTQPAVRCVRLMPAEELILHLEPLGTLGGPGSGPVMRLELNAMFFVLLGAGQTCR